MLITLLVVLVVVGVGLYLLNAMVLMDPRIKTAINAIALLLVFLYIVSALTGHHYLGT